MNNTINWIGSFSQGGGYSGSSEKMIIALERAGMDMRVMTFNPGKSPTKEGIEIKQKPFKLGDIGICYGFPAAFNSIKNKYKVGFTMFETDKLPSSKGMNPWSGLSGKASDMCNEMDLLLVPSEHNKELFRKEGVTVPIEVVNLGIDPNQYPTIIRPKRKTFTFLMTGVLTIRKNPGTALSCFLDLYKDREDVKVVFKTNSGTMGHIQMPYKNVIIIDEFSLPEQMFCYYRDADAFIFPSRGEGFGLTPVEAMATGLPTIFADNTGMSEFANKKYNYPIACPKKTPAQRFPPKWGDVGNWYEVDYHAFRDAMKEVETNRAESYEKGMNSAKWVHENLTFDNTASRIIELLRRYFG